MKINSILNNPSFSGTIRAKMVKIYDLDTKRYLTTVDEFSMNTNKISSVVSHVQGLSDNRLKNVDTFIITSDNSPLVYAFPSSSSYKYNQSQISLFADKNASEVFDITY